jgi:hypothetical protein
MSAAVEAPAVPRRDEELEGVVWGAGEVVRSLAPRGEVEAQFGIVGLESDRLTLGWQSLVMTGQVDEVRVGGALSEAFLRIL